MAKALTELRNRLSAVAQELSNSDDGITSQEAIVAFKDRHPDVIRDATTELVDMCLIKIFNDVKKRRPPVGSNNQLDLFAEYAINPIITLRIEENGRVKHIHKSLMRVTYPELQSSLTVQPKAMSQVSEEDVEKRRLLEDFKEFSNQPNLTFGDMLEAKKDTAEESSD